MSYGKLLLCLEYLIILITMQLAKSMGHMCYVCGGKEAELPFIESKSSLTSSMNNSCDGFENLSLEDRKRYEFECPKKYIGCYTKITASSIIRTCSEVSIDDCRRTFNEITEHICICKEDLCNKMNAQKIADELQGEIDIDSDDSETEESGDDDNISTIQTTNWPTLSSTANDVMENFNKSMIVPSINKSVSFNLSCVLAVICVSTSVHRSFS